MKSKIIEICLLELLRSDGSYKKKTLLTGTRETILNHGPTYRTYLIKLKGYESMTERNYRIWSSNYEK